MVQGSISFIHYTPLIVFDGTMRFYDQQLKKEMFQFILKKNPKKSSQASRQTRSTIQQTLSEGPWCQTLPHLIQCCVFIDCEYITDRIVLFKTCWSHAILYLTSDNNQYRETLKENLHSIFFHSFTSESHFGCIFFRPINVKENKVGELLSIFTAGKF